MGWFGKLKHKFSRGIHKIGKKIKKVPWKKIGKKALSVGKRVFHGVQKGQKIASKILNTASKLAPVLSGLGPYGQAAVGVINSAQAVNNTFGKVIDTVDALGQKHGSEINAMVDGKTEVSLPNLIRYGQTVHADAKALHKEIKESGEQIKKDAKKGVQHFNDIREGISNGLKRKRDGPSVGQPTKRLFRNKMRENLASSDFTK